MTVYKILLQPFFYHLILKVILRGRINIVTVLQMRKMEASDMFCRLSFLGYE